MKMVDVVSLQAGNIGAKQVLMAGDLFEGKVIVSLLVFAFTTICDGPL